MQEAELEVRSLDSAGILSPCRHARRNLCERLGNEPRCGETAGSNEGIPAKKDLSRVRAGDLTTILVFESCSTGSWCAGPLKPGRTLDRRGGSSGFDCISKVVFGGSLMLGSSVVFSSRIVESTGSPAGSSLCLSSKAPAVGRLARWRLMEQLPLVSPAALTFNEADVRTGIDNLRLRTPRNAREIGRTIRDFFCTGAQEVGPCGWCGDCGGSTPWALGLGGSSGPSAAPQPQTCHKQDTRRGTHAQHHIPVQHSNTVLCASARCVSFVHSFKYRRSQHSVGTTDTSYGHMRVCSAATFSNKVGSRSGQEVSDVPLCPRDSRIARTPLPVPSTFFLSSIAHWWPKVTTTREHLQWRLPY